MKKLTQLFLMLSFSWVIILGCSKGDISGTGHSGETFTAGIVQSSTGVPLSNMMLSFSQADYNPTAPSVPNHDAVSVVTGIDGGFELAVDTGLYTIFGQNETGFIYETSVNLYSDSTDVGTLTLKPAGQVFVSSQWLGNDTSVTIALLGTSLQYKIAVPGVVDTLGTTLDFPQGSLNLIKVTTDTTIEFNLMVQESSLVFLDSLWQ